MTTIFLEVDAKTYKNVILIRARDAFEASGKQAEDYRQYAAMVNPAGVVGLLAKEVRHWLGVVRQYNNIADGLDHMVDMGE